MLHIEQHNEESFKPVLEERLRSAKRYREPLEPQWRENELTVFQNITNGNKRMSRPITDIAAEFHDDDAQEPYDHDVAMNYTFKYLRYVHSQMSANPATVLVKPTSQQYQDRRAALAADRIIQYGRKHYKIAERVDQRNLATLTYGNGWLKLFINPTKGKPVSADIKTRRVEMDGDFDITTPSTWDIWIDPDAKCFDDVRYIFERHVLPAEKALWMFPEQKDIIKAHLGNVSPSESFWDEDSTPERKAQLIELYEYTEAGRPWNGFCGRHAFCLSDGTVLGSIDKNHTPGHGLPYILLTDVDVPNMVYGKTFIDWISRLQAFLNRLDSAVLDNIQVHGVARMLVPEGCKIEDEAITNSPIDLIRIEGNLGERPAFLPTPTLMPDIYRFREQLLAAMDSLAGMNEAMTGDIKRETSGFAAQTAINAGNLIRRRLFNKFQLTTEELYKLYLMYIQKHWTQPRMIKVVGDEGAIDVVYLKGADIEDGYDLIGEYGTSLSLDPSSRREEIMQQLPLLEKAGFKPQRVLSMLRFAAAEEMYDLADLAGKRQLEIFDEMTAKFMEDETATPYYIAPEDDEMHEPMLETAKEFRMSAAFKYLPEEVQELIKQHIKDRTAMAGVQAPQAAMPGMPIPGAGGGGMMPGGGMPPLA